MSRLELPETFHFLRVGWWIAHIMLISVIFLIGYWVGSREARRRRGE